MSSCSLPVPAIGTTPVMDIQPPQPATPTSPVVEEIPASDSGQEPVATPPATEENPSSQDSEPVPESGATTEVSSDAPAPNSEGQEGVIPTDQPTPTNPMAVPQTDHKKKGGKLVIILAVLIALAIAGVVVFLFMSKDTKDKTAETTNTQSTTEQVSAVTGQDVDDVTTEIDSQLSTVDDTADFSSNDLTDATLGL